MIAIGVARPSAHGHAMISTATALTRAVREPRLGAPDAPGDERNAGDDTTAGTKYSAIRSASR